MDQTNRTLTQKKAAQKIAPHPKALIPIDGIDGQTNALTQR